MSGGLVDALKLSVGADHVLCAGDLSAWELDWRKRYQGKALAVVLPANAQEVASVVQCCRAHGASLVPQGGNTGLVGGGVPDSSGTQIVLSLRRMNRIRQIDSANLTMTVDAGCVLQAAQEAADEAGMLFPLSLAAEGSCTIGGNLATNAGGTAVLRYGNARELCLGLEVVTAEGEIWDGLSGLRKDNTGYDLRDLYIGSEGTLGVITGATLKLHPRPQARITAFASCENILQAIALLKLAREHLDANLTAFEIMSAFSLSLVAKHFPQLPRPLKISDWAILLESHGSTDQGTRDALEAMLAIALEQSLVDDVALAESISQAKALWHIRESIPLAQAEEGLNIKHDIALPISAIPQFLTETDKAVNHLAPGARLVTFGHLGDGNLHYNVQAPEETSPAEFLSRHEAQINQLVYQTVMSHHGSISAEHGIGALKRTQLPDYKSAVALKLMRQLKFALDPKGLLNPNRVL